MQAFVITVVGIILGLVATLGNVIWLAVLAAVVALAGAYSQHRDAAPFEFVFSSDDWQKVGAEFNLVVPKRLHNKNKPIATVFEGLAPNFQEVVVAIKICSDSAVVIEANLTFQGKVVVK